MNGPTVTIQMSTEDYAQITGLLIDVKDGRQHNLSVRASEALRICRDQHVVAAQGPGGGKPNA